MNTYRAAYCHAGQMWELTQVSSDGEQETVIARNGNLAADDTVNARGWVGAVLAQRGDTISEWNTDRHSFGEVLYATAAKLPPTVDLMAALKASLERAREERDASGRYTP